MRYVLVVVACALMSSPALAQKTGFYMGFGIGMSEAQDVCDGVSGPGISCDDSDTATKILAGYQVNPGFAVEGGYTDLGKAQATFAGFGTATLEASAFEVVAIGMGQVGSGWSLYGKFGFFSWDLDFRDSTGLVGNDNESGTDLTFGFGVGYEITKNVGLRVEYQQYSDVGDEDPSDVTVIGANVLFRF